jgi:thioesterase domain-containing protein
MQKDTRMKIDDNLVLLKKRTGSPLNLFLIHDGTGEVDGYFEFCQHLNSNLNCWGIRADSLQDLAPQNWTIEGAARSYIEKIKKIQANGPYYITGWSIGGTISFEIASQLEQMNQKIGFLALIDSTPPLKKLYRHPRKFTLKSELNFVNRFLAKPGIKKKLKNATGLNQLWSSVVDNLNTNDYYLERIKAQIGEYVHLLHDNHQMNIKESVYYLNMIRTLRNAKALYTPSRKIHSPIHFFAANQSRGIGKKYWNDYCQKPIIIDEVTGDHFSIFQKPLVFEFSNIFSRIIRSFAQQF